MISKIHIYDYIVITIYLLGIYYLAFKSALPKKTSHLAQDQYLGGKSLTIAESLCSIVATEVSALTFLGIPAFAFSSDFSFIQIYFGAIIGRAVIAKVMLPLIYDKGLTVYSVMGKSGHKNAQMTMALFYATNKFLAVGVRLFSGSILIAEFFSIHIYMAIFLICILTFFYTLIGGLKAVVRTDMLQMALFIFGGLLAHYLIPQVAEQPWHELISIAHSEGKTSFIDFQNLWPFIIGVMGGVLFDMATHGVDQDFVQRLTGNKTMKGAQIAILASSIISIAVGLLFLSIGALLWSYYQTHSAPNVESDKIFAHFIISYFPQGLKGLMVAGVLAATMSTLDSTINALSACLYSDILNQRSQSAGMIKLYYLKDTAIISVILMFIAFVASTSQGLLLLGLKITSWSAGSLLALFFATLVFKITKITTKNIIFSYLFGVVGVYINNFLIQGNWNFNVYFGFLFSFFFLYFLNSFQKRSALSSS